MSSGDGSLQLLPPASLTVWGEADCRRVHAAMLELLEAVGVEVMYEPALGIFRQAGARVDERRVRIPAPLVLRADSVPARMQETAELCGEKESFPICAMPSAPWTCAA
ncbi:MAG TPA: trimethylamine methyltransferase family protein [Thermoleophilia bacterium]|nr:trimethylamine methyltransferase family protein [Thermoleophilia bacterium]